MKTEASRPSGLLERSYLAVDPGKALGWDSTVKQRLRARQNLRDWIIVSSKHNNNKVKMSEKASNSGSIKTRSNASCSSKRTLGSSASKLAAAKARAEADRLGCNFTIM